MGKGRAPCCDKTKVKSGPWSPVEDLQLINFIQKHGHSNWRALPKQAGLLRCGKSCRLRWINYLRPDVKRGNFTPWEEETIINLHNSIGNKWSKIAACLPGRTDNEIKNVWNTYLKKRAIKAKSNNSRTATTSTSSSSCTSSSNTMSTTTGDGESREKPMDNTTAQADDEEGNLINFPETLASPNLQVSDYYNEDLGFLNDPEMETIPSDIWEMLESEMDPVTTTRGEDEYFVTRENRDWCNLESDMEIGSWLRDVEKELGLTSEEGENLVSYLDSYNCNDYDNSTELWPTSPLYNPPI